MSAEGKYSIVRMCLVTAYDCHIHAALDSFETSAKEAINVEQAFQAACKNALQQDSEADM